MTPTVFTALLHPRRVLLNFVLATLLEFAKPGGMGVASGAHGEDST